MVSFTRRLSRTYFPQPVAATCNAVMVFGVALDSEVVPKHHRVTTSASKRTKDVFKEKNRFVNLP